MLTTGLFSLAPFSLPVSCWSSGCECVALCRVLGAAGCVAAAGLAAAGIFIALSFVHALRRLGGLRE